MKGAPPHASPQNSRSGAHVPNQVLSGTEKHHLDAPLPVGSGTGSVTGSGEGASGTEVASGDPVGTGDGAGEDGPADSISR
ncbi:hypothetical protein [Streptomyces sp. NRRL WC-3549]|uniref:hypothetical protein n=1 Tax=Streptomyces sp. NRRL WC-3549 TaxID=1463925 RepID=UPI0004CA580E|nr:hypothetical protein [Streptomyces sp. NRRL WC-3549]